MNLHFRKDVVALLGLPVLPVLIWVGLQVAGQFSLTFFFVRKRRSRTTSKSYKWLFQCPESLFVAVKMLSEPTLPCQDRWLKKGSFHASPSWTKMHRDCVLRDDEVSKLAGHTEAAPSRQYNSVEPCCY